MLHKLPELPYPLDALNPHMSRQTLEFHHGKHFLTYINNLNALIKGTRFEEATLETIIREADGGIFNNGAQVYNHQQFFESFSPTPQVKPEGKLAVAIDRDFGSLQRFIEEFTKEALALFGSGWAWLVSDAEGKLSIVKESNAGNPLRNGLKPLFGCDVWEHTYYLDYQNRRADYVPAFFKLLDWKVVQKRYEA